MQFYNGHQQELIIGSNLRIINYNAAWVSVSLNYSTNGEHQK